MAGRSRAELDEIRRVNRAELGLADYAPRMEGEPYRGEPRAGLGACCAECAQGRPCVAKGLAGPTTTSTGLMAPTYSVGEWGTFARAVPGVGAFVGPTVKVRTAFPPMDVEWDPNAPAGAQQQAEGPGWGMWFTQRVVRPEVEVGPIRYAPGDGFPDYSGIFAVGVGLAAAFGTGVAAWVLWRAFGGRP